LKSTDLERSQFFEPTLLEAGLPGPSEHKMPNHLQKNAKSLKKMLNKLKQAVCCWFWYYQISNLDKTVVLMNKVLIITYKKSNIQL